MKYFLQPQYFFHKYLKNKADQYKLHQIFYSACLRFSGCLRQIIQAYVQIFYINNLSPLRRDITVYCEYSHRIYIYCSGIVHYGFILHFGEVGVGSGNIQVARCCVSSYVYGSASVEDVCSGAGIIDVQCSGPGRIVAYIQRSGICDFIRGVC